MEKNLLIQDLIKESIEVKTSISQKDIDMIADMASEIVLALKNNKKVLICGNGGSAADSQHFAAELVGRFKINRRGLPSIALTTDTSILTAIGNDFGYDKVFSKQVEALAQEGDILIGISTSGNSPNVLEAYNIAKEKQVKCFSFLGKDGGKMLPESDAYFLAKSSDTARIQETHILIIHILCEIVEKEMFS